MARAPQLAADGEHRKALDAVERGIRRADSREEPVAIEEVDVSVAVEITHQPMEIDLANRIIDHVVVVDLHRKVTGGAELGLFRLLDNQKPAERERHDRQNHNASDND